MSTKDDLKSITCGVLFNHSFKLLDYWGEIADDILYGNKYFPEGYFNNITAQYTTDRNLYNTKTLNSLALTANSITYSHNIVNSFENEYKEFCKRIEEYIVPSILSKYNLITRRVGIVYICKFEDKEISKFASNYFKPDVNGISDFRFSKKEMTKKGALWSNSNDYINKIFTVGNVEEDVKGISYDYQLHYVPIKTDIRDNISNFLKNSLNAFDIDIIKSTEG